MEKLEGHFTRGWGDGSTRAEIELVDGALDEATRFLRETGDADDAEAKIETIHQLVESLDDPYGLELLATVHWVMPQGGKNTDDDIVTAVHAWNERKRKLFPREHILVAAQRLRKRGWIAAA